MLVAWWVLRGPWVLGYNNALIKHQWYNSYYSKSSHLPSISLFKKQKWKWEAEKKIHWMWIGKRNKKEHWEKEQRDTLNTPPCWSLGSYWNIRGPSLGLGGNHLVLTSFVRRWYDMLQLLKIFYKTSSPLSHFSGVHSFSRLIHPDTNVSCLSVLAGDTVSQPSA